MSRGRYRGPTVLEQLYSSIDREKGSSRCKDCKSVIRREGRARGETSFRSAFSNLTGQRGKGTGYIYDDYIILYIYGTTYYRRDDDECLFSAFLTPKEHR